MVRVDGGADDRLSRFDEDRRRRRADPGIGLQAHVAVGAVAEVDAQRRRHDQLVVGADDDLRALGGVAVDRRDAFDAIIERPVIVVPAAVPPAEILTALAFHGAEKVVGLGMLERPGGDEAAEGRIEAVRSEDLFPQQGQAQGRFEIGQRVTVFFGDDIGAGEDRRRLGIFEQGQDVVDRIAALGRIFAVALGTVFAVVEILGLIDVDEGVEALVHPGMAALVETDDHREPAVANLVRRDPEQGLAGIVDAVEDDARIFHARRRPGNVDRRRPRIGIPALGEVLDCVFHVFGRAAPAGVALAFGRVEGHGYG